MKNRKASNPSDESDRDLESGTESRRPQTENGGRRASLADSERLYRGLVENLNQVIYTIRFDGTIDYVSPAAEDIFGYSVDEFKDRHFIEFIDPRDRKQLEREFQELLEGKFYPSEYRMLDRDGTSVWIRTSTTPIIESGNVVGFIGVLEDVSRIRDSERQLEFQSRILDQIGDFVTVTDLEGTVTYVNAAVERMLGRTKDEIIGTSVHSFGEDSLRGTTQDEIIRNTREKGSWSGEVVNTVSGGGERILAFRSWVVVDAAGTPSALCAVSRDITEQKQYEQSVERSEGLFRGLFDHMNSGVAIYEVRDDGQRFVFKDINPAGERIGGIPRESLVGRDVEEIFPGIRKLGLLDVFNRVWRTGEAEILSAREYSDDRSSYWVENRVYKLPSGEVVAVYDDVSERRRVHEEMEKHRKNLRELSTRLIETQETERQKISRELHDVIGQALTALKINLDAIRDLLPLPVQSELEERIGESTELADGLLVQIREISLELRPSILDDLGLIPALRWYGDRFASRLGIEIDFDTSGKSRRLGSELEINLYRIIQEGLTNVARHADATRVAIRVGFSESFIEILIKDNGKGFSDDVGTESDLSGIGLISIRERVEGFGGIFDIDSAPDAGTELYVKIPCDTVL